MPMCLMAPFGTILGHLQLPPITFMATEWFPFDLNHGIDLNGNWTWTVQDTYPDLVDAILLKWMIEFDSEALLKFLWIIVSLLKNNHNNLYLVLVEDTYFHQNCGNTICVDLFQNYSYECPPLKGGFDCEFGRIYFSFMINLPYLIFSS